MRFGSMSPIALIALIALTAFVGCGGSSTTSNGDSTGPTPNDGIVDLQNLLKELSSSGQPVPKNLAELAPHDPVHPIAAVFLQNGSITYYWGTPVNASAPDAAKTVIAHESTVDSKGGWVLLQDGSTKQMTAEEFKAAPKPKK